MVIVRQSGMRRLFFNLTGLGLGHHDACSVQFSVQSSERRTGSGLLIEPIIGLDMGDGKRPDGIILFPLKYCKSLI